MNRRAFPLVLAAGLRCSSAAATGPPPTQALTRGPKFHWFGYYDVIKIGMIDLADGDKWT